MSLFPALPIHNWSNRPAANSVNPGTTIRVIDVGLPIGIIMTSDGVNWLPAGPQVIARSGAAVSVTGTTAEIALLTVTLPGNLLALSSAVRLSYGCSYTNNANSKTFRLRLGGAALRTSARNTSAFDLYQDTVRNRGATGSQGTILLLTGGTLSLATSTVDTTVSNDLAISVQLAVGTDTAALEQATVELLP